MSESVVKKKIPDSALVRRHNAEYMAAKTAAWMALSEDRRFLGAQKFKLLFTEVAALRAIGSETSALKEITIASRGGDPKGVAMLNEGYKNACDAAKRAADKIAMDRERSV